MVAVVFPPASLLANTEYDFTIAQNNTAVIPFTVNDGAAAYNLTGNVVTFYLKATNKTPDSAAFSDTAALTTAALGEFSVVIPGLQNTVAGAYWYRIDAAAPTRSDTGCGTTLNSVTVTDTSAVAADLGAPITNTNIPAGTAITAVSVGVGYTISQQASSGSVSQTFVVGGAITTLLFGTVTVLPV